MYLHSGVNHLLANHILDHLGVFASLRESAFSQRTSDYTNGWFV